MQRKRCCLKGSEKREGINRDVAIFLYSPNTLEICTFGSCVLITEECRINNIIFL